MRRSGLLWMAGAAAILLSACMTIGGVKDSTGKNSRMATFVIGVEPKDAWLAIFPGEIREGRINFSDVSRAVYYGPSKDGYVIGQVASDKPLGIMQVRLVSKPGGFIGTNYVACGGGKTLTFVPKIGSVAYLGNVRYEAGADELDVAYVDRFDEAKAFLQSHYPELGSLVERSEPEVLPAIDACGEIVAYPFPR